MEIEKAINTAVEYEVRVREVYVEALDEATDKVGRRIFKLLADEEDRHVKYLESKLASWKEDGRLSADDLDTAVPSAELVQAEVAKLDKAMEPQDRSREVAMLEKAREVEKETTDFYARLVKDLPGEASGFFKRFMEIEQGHLEIVQAEIDALNGLGYWFDMPEFNLENG